MQGSFLKMVKIEDYDELNGVMNRKKYNEWYETIRDNNRAKAEEMFKYLSPDEVRSYTNQEFNFGDNIMNCSWKEWIYKPTKALFLAAIFNSYDILDLFFEIQVNFKQKDKSGDNIMHSLIFMCYNDREQKHQFISAYEYLVAMLPSETTKEILLMENQEGLRPLELAISLSCVEFFSVIFETKPLYKAVVHECGVQEFSWYDITEYESVGPEARSEYSPMRFITELEEDVFEDPDAEKMLESPVIKQWFDKKLQMNIPFLLVWCILRISHIVMFYISISAGGSEIPRSMNMSQTETNATTGNQETTYTQVSQTTSCPTYIYYSVESTVFQLSPVYLIAYGCLIVIFDVLEMILAIAKSRKSGPRVRPAREKRRISSDTFYRYFRTLKSLKSFGLTLFSLLSIF